MPERFEFGDNGLRISVVGGQLSRGQIEIKTIDEEDKEGEYTFSTGIVTMSAIIAPASIVQDPELRYSLTFLPNGTTFEIFIPRHLSTFRSCISLNAVILVPKKLIPYVVINVQNARIIVQDSALHVKSLSLETTNSAIEFSPQWHGDALVLQTTNAHIDIYKPIVDCASIIASTTNGHVRLHNTIEASDVIHVETTNGAIDADKTLDSQGLVKLTTTNGHVQVEQVKGTLVEIKTTNAYLDINHAFIDGLLHAQTTNSHVKLKVDGTTQPQITARTTNSNIDTWMVSTKK